MGGYCMERVWETWVGEDGEEHDRLGGGGVEVGRVVRNMGWRGGGRVEEY